MRSSLVYTVLAFSLMNCAAGVFAQNQTPLMEPASSGYTPKEIHQIMWEGLKPRLELQQQMSQIMTAKAGTNWREYDIGYYNIDLRIDHVAKIIYGRVEVQGTIQTASLDSIVLDLLAALTVDSVYNSSGRLSVTHQNDHIAVGLEKAYLPDEPFAFTVVYHGTPSGSTSFLGFNFTTRNGLPLITTLSEPFGARSWWPCNDITVDKADSVDMIVTVDTSLRVSSNGVMVSDVNNSDGTHTVHWEERYPIATYLISLGIHPYAVWGDWYHYGPTDSMPLQYFVYPDHDSYSRPYFAVIPNMIRILAERYGEYPFIDEKYGCTHFNWGGAMEHQTNTSTTASSFGYDPSVIVHELSHQWWGDMVTCGDWHHIWINEGFATFSEGVYFEGLNGSAYYHTYMNSFEYTSGGRIFIDDTTNVGVIFGSIVYDKGGWVLHMLRHVVGDDTFFQAMRNFRDQYLWSSATTENFRDVVEAESGMELDWFFQEWIYGIYRPNYRYSYLAEADPSGGWNTYLHIRQIQDTSIQTFTMPIDIQINAAAGNSTSVVFNNRRSQNFILHTINQPTGVSLDPERWISRQVSAETYSFHLVTDSLAGGTQFEPYEDTVIVKGGSKNYLWRTVAGALPDGIVLDSLSGILSGRPMSGGTASLTVQAIDRVYPTNKDSLTYALSLASVPPLPGDANKDGSVNVGDAVYIINYVFKGGPKPVIPNWGDTNADCAINAGDAVYIINYVFKGGPAPIVGCV